MRSLRGRERLLYWRCHEDRLGARLGLAVRLRYLHKMLLGLSYVSNTYRTILLLEGFHEHWGWVCLVRERLLMSGHVHGCEIEASQIQAHARPLLSLWSSVSREWSYL